MLETVRTMKMKKDKEKLEAKRMRIQERLNEIGHQTTMTGKKGDNSFIQSFNRGGPQKSSFKPKPGLQDLVSRSTTFHAGNESMVSKTRKVHIMEDAHKVRDTPDQSITGGEIELLINHQESLSPAPGSVIDGEDGGGITSNV